MSGLPFTLRQLEIFASICATRSFRRSAELLGISQASVSNQMKVLEDQLGLTLLERRPGRRPTLTADGVAFLDDLVRFNAAAEALAAHRLRGGAERAVRYRVLVGRGLLDNFIRPRLDRFLAAHPLIEITFDARPPSSGLARDIENGDYDFAMIHRRADRPVEPHFRDLALVRGGIYGHREFAADRQLPLPAELLNTLPFIMPLAASAQEREMLQFLDRFGIRPRRVAGYTQYFDVMAAMLERGVGIASFTDAILPPDMRRDVIMLHPLENWRLLWFRKDAGADPRCNAVEAFLWSSVLQDESYPTITAFAGAG